MYHSFLNISCSRSPSCSGLTCYNLLVPKHPLLHDIILIFAKSLHISTILLFNLLFLSHHSPYLFHKTTCSKIYTFCPQHPPVPRQPPPPRHSPDPYQSPTPQISSQHHPYHKHLPVPQKPICQHLHLLFLSTPSCLLPCWEKA